MDTRDAKMLDSSGINGHKDRGPILRETEFFNDRTVDLHNAIAMLESALDPIVASSPANGAKEQPKAAPTCELHEKLSASNERLQTAIDRLQSLCSRIRL